MDVLLCGRFDADERREWHAALAGAAPGVRWLDEAAALVDASRVRAAVVANPAPGSLQGLPALGLVQSLWAGVDKLLADPTVPTTVPLARMVDPMMSMAMAETALWAVLALQRDFFTYARQQREGRWQQHPQRRAEDLRVTVLGLGEMGRAVAAVLAGRGHRVAGWSLSPRAAPGGVEVGHGAAALPALLARSDVLINLLPLTDATRGILDARCFTSLPRGAGVVNLARGGHVVDADLLGALDVGQVGHAVLDVFHAEPLPAAHRFWTHPRVTVLPHVAAATDVRSAAAVVARNLAHLAAGRPLEHLVDRTRGY